MLHTKRAAAILTAAVLLAGMTALPGNAADSLLHSADFEGGTSGWSSFGGTTVSSTTADKHTGSAALSVTGRTDSWNGASCDVGSIFTAGQTYHVTAWVKGQSGDTVTLMFKYNDGSKDQYVGLGSAGGGSWGEISADCEVPAGATGMLLYFQTDAGTNDFLVDDVAITGQASWSEETLAETPLKDIYANYFKIGCAATPAELTTPISQEIVKRHFNSLTVGNELKPDYVLDKAATQSSGKITVSLAQASSVLKFCEDNGIPVRGHVFCWYSQTPAWFFRENFSDSGSIVSKEVMNERLDTYIKEVFSAISTQYPDLDVYCWDVVNECYLDDGSLRKGGTDPSNQESYWSLIYGDNSYIEQAFTSARKYAPAGTKLFYNDFNEYIPAKRDAIYDMAKKLADKNLIDGIGMQSHLDVGYPDAKLYRQAIDKYNSLGLEVQITELDITDYNSGADSDSVAKAYKEIMAQIVDAKKSGANITACVFWGITDGTSWRSTGYPLLLNADYSLKKAYASVKNAVPESEWGKAEETTKPTEPQPTETETETVPTETEPTETEQIPTETEDIHSLPLYQAGDVNCDHATDMLDVVRMQKYLLGAEPSLIALPEDPNAQPNDREIRIMTDLNGDGEVDVFDLALLKRLVTYGTFRLDLVDGHDEYGQPIVID